MEEPFRCWTRSLLVVGCFCFVFPISLCGVFVFLRSLPAPPLPPPLLRRSSSTLPHTHLTPLNLHNLPHTTELTQLHSNNAEGKLCSNCNFTCGVVRCFNCCCCCCPFLSFFFYFFLPSFLSFPFISFLPSFQEKQQSQRKIPKTWKTKIPK